MQQHNKWWEKGKKRDEERSWNGDVETGGD